jgi:CubicO group peptidase (beta-lactamase class C family)
MMRLDDRLGGLHGVVAVRNGQTLLEHYGSGEDFSWGDALGVVEFGPETLHDLRSVTKSVTALLYGIALGEGLVPPPTEPLLRSFPEYPDLAADPGRAGLLVEHALTMSLGLEWREDILQRPIVEPPGHRWSYCGGATALLGRLLADGTGQPLPQYAQQVLFAPLGIGHFEWRAGSDGVASPASGLRLAPRDLARIGELVAAEGVRDDRRIVPADWTRTMLRPRLSTDWGAEFGYQWYIEPVDGHRMVAGMGNGGQRLFVLPDLGLVVAVTAGNYDDPEQWRTPRAVLQTVLAEVA